MTIHANPAAPPSRWEARHAGGHAITITDSDHPGIQARFVFNAGRLTAWTIAVEDTAAEPDLTVSRGRDLPMTRWEQAARAEAAAVDEGAARLDPSGVLLELAAEMYRANVRAGLRNPVGAIAESFGVKPGTARSWIHRARKAGLLGPALPRTAGEQHR